MGIFGGVLRPRASATESAWGRILNGGGGATTKSGVRVTEDNAMRMAAVWACVRAASEDIAKLPLHLHRRLPGGGKERATDHPHYGLMHDAPNGVHTSFQFREMMQAAVELRGNGYAFKVRVRGQVRELLPLEPSKVTVSRRGDWETVYKVGSKEYTRADIFHLAGLSLDGFTGVSPITYHRETIGLAMAAEKHGALLFGNGARPGMVAEAPAGLSPEAQERLKESIERATAGDNVFRLLVLEEGAKLSSAPVSMTNEDAQYVELRKFQLGELARIFRMPPHKVGDLDRATFSNIEHQALEYVTDSLMPRLARWEQRLNADLLTPAEREEYFFEFNIDGLLRGDTKSRYEAHQIAFLNGLKARNEIRAQENLNPVEGGDEFRVPANTLPAGATPEE